MGRWVVGIVSLMAIECLRVPDSITITAVGADPASIPQPHAAVSATWFLSPQQVLMAPPTTTTLPVGIGR
jgi:hypothetical protein